MQNDKQLSDLEMQRKGRLVFMLMVVFFIVPIVVVILMYKFNWKPSGNSLGELVNPPHQITTAIDMKDAQGRALPDQFWQTKWSVVYVAGECTQACLAKLHDIRQLHVSLYKDIERAQRVLITTTQDVTRIQQDYPDLIIINQPEAAVLALSKQFQIKEENVALSNRLYLVDSMGYLMMSYPASLPLADVRKDITRLLRYSWAG